VKNHPPSWEKLAQTKNYSKLLGFFNEEKKISLPPPKISKIREWVAA